MPSYLNRRTRNHFFKTIIWYLYSITHYRALVSTSVAAGYCSVGLFLFVSLSFAVAVSFSGDASSRGQGECHHIMRVRFIIHMLTPRPRRGSKRCRRRAPGFFSARCGCNDTTGANVCVQAAQTWRSPVLPSEEIAWSTCQ